MMRWIAILAAVVVLVWPLPEALAQKASVYSQQQTLAPPQPLQQVAGQQAIKRETAEIAPGQSLDEVAAILRQHNKEFGEFWFSFARSGSSTGEEVSHIGVTLDAEHTAAAIFYDVRTKRVTSILINLKLTKSSPKAEQFWLSARKITLLPDESFSIHFEKPTPPRPPAERPKNVYPTNPQFRGNNQIPANPIGGSGRF
jgi:hypothetical protein